MDYQKKTVTGGKYANKAELYEQGVKRAKIVSETNDEPSQFKDKNGNLKMEATCKVLFQGQNEGLKTRLNQATINALVDAFGGNSKLWMNHELGVQIDKWPGKKYYLYLIPEGYKTVENDDGYIDIVKEGTDTNERTVLPPLDEEPPAMKVPF